MTPEAGPHLSPSATVPDGVGVGSLHTESRVTPHGAEHIFQANLFCFAHKLTGF